MSETVELSSRLQFVMKDMGYQFPLYPIPEGETMDTNITFLLTGSRIKIKLLMKRFITRHSGSLNKWKLYEVPR